LPLLHVAHSAPLLPQSVLDVPAWQLPLASQQPVGQLVASHTHAPFTHSCPVAHVAQSPPVVPQLALVLPVSQVVPLQHPVAQSAGPQNTTQLWPEHSSVAPHATQAAPPAPHAPLAVPSWQLEVTSQQPVEQLFASQTHRPATHSWPLLQATQAAPPVPHTVLAAPPWQLPDASQQPLAQLFASHWHRPPVAPATHSCPPGHATQAAPLAPQTPVAVPVWQLPDASQQPSGQLVPLHKHWPSTQSLPVAHVLHVAPLAPHCSLVSPVSQVAPLQHPLQSVESQ
jgi:hypothetical protein